MELELKHTSSNIYIYNNTIIALQVAYFKNPAAWDVLLQREIPSGTKHQLIWEMTSSII